MLFEPLAAPTRELGVTKLLTNQTFVKRSKNKKWEVCVMNKTVFLFSLILGLTVSNPTFALFKSMEELDQEYLAKYTPEDRIMRIKNYLELYEPFLELTESERDYSFHLAASKVGQASCLKNGVDGKSLPTLPRWLFDQGAFLYGAPSHEFTDRYQHPKQILAWAIVGLMSDDPKPCDLAKAVYDKKPL